MDRKQKQKQRVDGEGINLSTPISIKPSSKTIHAGPAVPTNPSTLTPTSTTGARTPGTPSSLLSKSMQSSFKHEIIEFGGHESPSPVIVSTSGHGFQWNRDVFMKDEYYYSGHHHAFKQQQQQDEWIVAHEIHLDEEEDFMFQ